MATASENAISILRTQLAKAKPGSPEQTQLSIALYDLENPSKTSLPKGTPLNSAGDVTRDTKTLPTNETKSTDTDTTAPLLGYNVLNGYRSYTYNFTLAGLPADALDNPTIANFEVSSQNLVILKSSGKGSTGTISQYVSKDISIANSETSQDTSKLIEGFNQYSPGRFDMFIDNVEITTLMGFTQETNTTIPTQIKFEVYEPYSINGFIEALQAAARAAGYVTYAQASFVLKMSFTGYPDGDGTPDVEMEIPGATRYFIFNFTGLEVEVTERGTRYRCAAVPYNDIGLANLDNSLRQPIQVQGKKVGEILKNFMSEVEAQRREAAENAKVSPKDYDRYSIIFPSLDSKTSGLDYSTDNKNITEVDFVIDLKDTKVFGFSDAAAPDTKPNAYKILNSTIAASDNSLVNRAEPTGSSVVVFSSGANIHECISSIIADSTYTRQLIENIGKDGSPDQYGMVNYFVIRLETTNRSTINDQTKRPYQNFTYVVSPYKVHYTLVPNYSSQTFDFKKLKLAALREYNYIYTGKNIDVLNFKLNFNTLFFEAIPNNMGNSDQPDQRTTAGKKEEPDVKKNPDDVTQNKESYVITQGQFVHSPYSLDTNMGRAPAGLPQTDPYWSLSRAMHNAVTNSKASMIQGEMEIVGDPFYLATGGVGNYRPDVSGKGTNNDGAVNQYYGQLFILINFRNPEDILPLDRGGMVFFNPQQVAFSGVYRVTEVVNSFRSGFFKQDLKMLRMSQSDQSGPGSTDSQSPDTSIPTTTTSKSGSPPIATNAASLRAAINNPVG